MVLEYEADALAAKPPGLRLVAPPPLMPVEPRVVFHGPRNAKIVALTFDACATRQPRTTSIMPATLRRSLSSNWAITPSSTRTSPGCRRIGHDRNWLHFPHREHLARPALRLTAVLDRVKERAAKQHCAATWLQAKLAAERSDQDQAGSLDGNGFRVDIDPRQTPVPAKLVFWPEAFAFGKG